ncbi:BglII/BstYI family type II restriction endonuclease [Litorimonas sp. RW-G-Af-16]|uniref:BglII/BstYI family type II restriction endonuclease n=1 Tax=Litorimonas sp. RW-G-Af-16 TaxID=3241168 RepID=UPI00390CAB43
MSGLFHEGDVSSGRGSDSNEFVNSLFSKKINSKFEIFSYRNAAGILSTSFPEQFKMICDALESFQITEKMIRIPGGSKGEIAKYVDTLFEAEWRELRISADLHVKLLDANKKSEIVDSYIKEGYLDGHRIDFVRGKVALDLEWNSKDQTYDRDLFAFSSFYDAGAIDVGVIITRGSSLNTDYFRKLGKVLEKDGVTEGKNDVYSKFGASTTWLGKLLYRLDAGRNGGCPVLAFGITPECIISK